jgi:preprotein translocase subunit SecF
MRYTFCMEEHIGETVERILERNARVESDKAWETSLTRIGSIALITYICAALVMLVIGVGRPFLSALIPTMGFILSTQSLPFIKKWWLRDVSKERGHAE